MGRCSLWGEKPTFGPLSKCNTGMAALRAGLPVTNPVISTNNDTYSAVTDKKII